MKLLIVEDDPMVAMIHQEYLKKMALDLEIKQVNRIGGLMELIDEWQPDLMLLDNYLPDGKGVSVVHHVDHIPIIMITAASDTRTVQKAITQGVVDYLVKPFTFDRFEKAINKALQYSAIFSKSKVAQDALDDYLYGKDTRHNPYELPKGLTKVTLQKIIEEIEQHDGEFTTQFLADALNISRITIKKYLNFLVETSMLMEDADYLTSGRPVSVYRTLPEKNMRLLLNRLV